MRVEVGNNNGFPVGIVENVASVLKNAVAPVVKKPGTEYAVIISFGSVCIFRVNIDQKIQLIKGSIVRQSDGGSLKIGFVDIFDEDIVNSIYVVIQEHWRRVREDADGECSVMYSPQKKVANF